MRWPVTVLVTMAIIGTAGAGVAVINASSPQDLSRAATPTSSVNDQIAGSGIIEASSGTIAVGTPVSGLVARMDVTWNQQVPKGATLFSIDARDLINKRSAALAAITLAQAALPAVERKLSAISAPQMADFVTKTDLIQRQSDVAVARANIQAARAQLAELNAEIARRTVRAPITGRVLKINIRPGEYADGASATNPVLLMGSDDSLFVRVDVDEHDTWRVRPGAAAQAFVQGNHSLRAPLRFVRVEPFVQPKLNLTGGPTERTDTRVLQLIYRLDSKSLPVFIGQQVDVLISPARKPGARS